MKRAAIYGRYSTDLQLDRSIADQFALCDRYAASKKLDVIAQFEDRARSAASLQGRPGIAALMDRAKRREFDVVIVESLDRISRDMEDLAGVHKRLNFYGVRIDAVQDGEANTLLVGIRGLTGQMFREDNAHKVRRGLSGRVREGLSAGGSVYGYRTDPAQSGQASCLRGRGGDRSKDI
jgi:DNA invertase Pin-like site-specific DNA recombinase